VSRIEIGIEEARKDLGALVAKAQQGADIVLTRRGKPAARIVSYQEAAMDITLALIDADIDGDRITRNPLGEITISDPDGSRISVVSEPMDDDPDTEWWMAIRYDTDGSEAMIYEGTDVGALVRTLAAAAA
jgi:prevent-host-death family protein